jgi:hypothetical protein
MVWKYLVAVGFALHGLIHSMGFMATWQLGKISAVSAAPNLLSGVAAGSGPAKVLGLLWLAALIAFLSSAGGLVTGQSWWLPLAAAAAVLSLALSIVWWNDAKFGALIDIAILLGLAVTALVARPTAA